MRRSSVLILQVNYLTGRMRGMAGYSAGGILLFEETLHQFLLLSGNQEIFYFDNGIGLTWKKNTLSISTA